MENNFLKKAIKEREQDQAREAAQAKTQQSPANIKFEQFKKLKIAEIGVIAPVEMMPEELELLKQNNK